VGPEPVWTLQRKYKYLAPARKQTLIPWLCSPSPTRYIFVFK